MASEVTAIITRTVSTASGPTRLVAIEAALRARIAALGILNTGVHPGEAAAEGDHQRQHRRGGEPQADPHRESLFEPVPEDQRHQCDAEQSVDHRQHQSGGHRRREPTEGEVAHAGSTRDPPVGLVLTSVEYASALSWVGAARRPVTSLECRLHSSVESLRHGPPHDCRSHQPDRSHEDGGCPQRGDRGDRCHQ